MSFPPRRAQRLLASLGLITLVAVSACSTAAAATGSVGSTATDPAAAATAVTSAGAGLRLLVEPGQMAPIYSLLSGARHSVDMTMYELVDLRAERILSADAGRGVRVRVVLDRNRERSENTAAYRYLNAHRVRAVWAPSSYAATHEKAVVVDAGYPDERALIMTLNLTSRYYPTTRDFAIIDSRRADVAAIESVFEADFAGRRAAPTPAGTDLIWSPGSEAALVAMIRSARTSVSVENEEMSNPGIVDALEADARREIRTRVVMTWDPDYRHELSGIAAAGGEVRTYPDASSVLYIHAKAIVVDAATAHARAFIGSENFSTASLEFNRELGLVITGTAILDRLAATLSGDYAAAG
jgi:cardiolipin synthase A/B